jgi:two-component system, NarL family, nitrate/nitrite response regulator NarL
LGVTLKKQQRYLLGFPLTRAHVRVISSEPDYSMITKTPAHSQKVEAMIARHASLFEIPGDSRITAADYADPSTPVGQGKTIVVVTRGRLFRDGIRSVLESPGRTILSHFESLKEIPDLIPPPALYVAGVGEAEDPADVFFHVRRLHRTPVGSKWLILTARTDPEFLAQATDCGVDWLLPEDAPAEVLRLLTDLILLEKSAAPTRLTRFLTGTVPETAERGHALPPRPPAAPARAIHPAPRAPAASATSAAEIREAPMDFNVERRQVELSDREKEILACLVSGLSNKIIARKLSIAEATVKAHVKGLLRKLQVVNRTQAAILALNILAGSPVDRDKIQ